DDGTPGQKLRSLGTLPEACAQGRGAVEQGDDAIFAQTFESDQVAEASFGIDLDGGHGVSVFALASQVSRMICAANASIAAPCLRLAEPRARCSAKRRVASFEV